MPNASDSESWFDTWRLRAIASSVGAELAERFGRHRHYTPRQVREACVARRVTARSRACALAMFARPEGIEETLREHGITVPAEKFRRLMAQKISSSATTVLIDPGGSAPFLFDGGAGGYGGTPGSDPGSGCDGGCHGGGGDGS